MPMRTRIALSLSFGLSSLPLAGAAHGQAFYLQEQSARAAGRAFSGEAADTGPSSLWWNPAAIADSERIEAAIAASVILPRGEVRDTGTLIGRPGQPFAPVGGDPVTRNPIRNGVLPSGAVAVPLANRVALGLVLSSPYSFTTDYPATSWARYSALRTKLRIIDIQPSIAVAATDWLRIGAGINVEYADATFANALPNLLATLPDGRQQLKGNGWDVGWSAGVQMHNDWATVGISYKSAVKHHLTGSIEVGGLVGPLAASNMSLSGIKATFRTPAQIIVGGRFRATDRLTLNAQFVRFTWSKFDSIRLGAPLDTVIPENYRNSWSLAGGIDYAASPRLTLRAGVQRALTPSRNGERDARVPDSNRWNFAAGASYAPSPGITVDAAVNYVNFADATIDRVTAAFAGTPAQTPILTSGELRNAHALVLSLGGRFRL